jgi:protease I
MTEQKRPALNGLRVAIIVAENFEQVEMTAPRGALEQAGAKVTLISLKHGKVTGVNHDVKADSFDVQMTLDEANPNNFDALMLPGGALNADKLRMEMKAREFARSFDTQNKPMAVICHAPWLLVSSNLVNGRMLTSWPTVQDDIRNAGGHWLDKPVVCDQNWVTSRGPHDIPAFNKAMLTLFSMAKDKAYISMRTQVCQQQQAT